MLQRHCEEPLRRSNPSRGSGAHGEMDCFASLALTLRGPSAHFEPASWGRSCRLSHGEARAGAAAILSQPPADLVPVALIELGRVGFLRRLAHAGVQRMGVVAD